MSTTDSALSGGTATAESDPGTEPDTNAVIQRHSTHCLPKRLFVALCLFTVLTMTGCQDASQARDELVIPAPSWAVNPRRVQLDDGRHQLDFTVAESYPSSRTRDFYAQWATEQGWTQVAPESERLSSDSWISFETEGGPVDQRITHWRSPDGARSLRLALVHRNNRSSQEVFLIESPFYLLPDGRPAAVGPKEHSPADPTRR